jgi:hypothetical protein
MKKKLRISRKQGATRISWSWRTPWTFVAFLVGPVLILAGPRLGLVPFLWMAGGAYCLVWGMVSLVNRTTITLTSEAMEVVHGPIPWLASRKIPLEEIQRVTRKHSIRNTGHPSQGGTFRHYFVEVVTSLGRFRLAQGVDSERQADEIIEVIEKTRVKQPSAPPLREVPRACASFFIAGVKIDPDTDLAEMVRRQLRGLGPWNTREDVEANDGLVRALYDSGKHRRLLVDALAGLLTDPDPVIRTGVVLSVCFFAEDLGADFLADLLEHHRELFDGVSPQGFHSTDPDLAMTLVTALASVAPVGHERAMRLISPRTDGPSGVYFQHHLDRIR